MKRRCHAVFGHQIPSPRASVAGLFWLASLLSLPAFAVLSLVELFWRWLT